VDAEVGKSRPVAAAWHSSELEVLAQKYGTPFFLYDADLMRARIDHIRGALRDLVRVYFAVKANPNLALLRAVRGAADGLDISSVGELEQALAAGFEPACMSFAGPGKSDQELERAIRVGIGGISVESLRELDACAQIARSTGKKANVVLRINPILLNRAFGMKMGGRAVQFGIDEEELGSACDRLRGAMPHVLFRGIHVYAGSQCFEPSGIVEGVENTFRLAGMVEAALGVDCRTINLGGGFGVSLGPERRELDIYSLADELVPSLQRFIGAKSSGREIVFELGRYLTSDFGVYVCRVVSTKQSRGKRFIVVDGGLHHHLAAAGTFGAAMRSNFPIENLSRPGESVERCSIAGPSCNPTDLLGIDVDLPRPEEGDLLVVLKSGGYGLTASPILFLGRPTAVELVRDRGRIVEGRRRRTILDFN
jgi:diaminopimelate decarboxylase